MVLLPARLLHTFRRWTSGPSKKHVPFGLLPAGRQFDASRHSQKAGTIQLVHLVEGGLAESTTVAKTVLATDSPGNVRGE